MVMQFLERFVNRRGLAGENYTVVNLDPSPEEIAAEEAAVQKSNEEWVERKRREENEILQRRIELLKQIDSVVRPMLLKINEKKFNGLGKITVRPEITEVRVAQDWVDLLVNDHFLKKRFTHYALEWRTQETDLNGFCITIRILDDELEQQNPTIALNTEQFWTGFQVAEFKDKKWVEKLREALENAIETGKTRRWSGVPEEKDEIKTDPVPAFGYKPAEEVEGEELEQEYPFPESCKKCGSPFGAQLLKEAYHTHQSVIECPSCSTPVHRRKHKGD